MADAPAAAAAPAAAPPDRRQNRTGWHAEWQARVEERSAAIHAALEATALAVGAKASVRRGGVTSHTLPDTCSFDALDQLQAAWGAALAEPVHVSDAVGSAPFGGLARIGEVRGRLVYAGTMVAPTQEHDRRAKRARVHEQLKADGGHAAASAAISGAQQRGKRKRDDSELCVVDRIQRMLDQLRERKASSDAELKVAEEVLTRAHYELRGAQDETAVESVGIFAKRLSTGATAERLVLAIRMLPGVAVALRDLRHVLGACWSDGLFSVEEEVMSVKRSDLPRTSEGSLAADFGMAPMMVVTAVPHGGGGGLRAGGHAERDARQQT